MIKDWEPAHPFPRETSRGRSPRIAGLDEYAGRSGPAEGTAEPRDAWASGSPDGQTFWD